MPAAYSGHQVASSSCFSLQTDATGNMTGGRGVAVLLYLQLLELGRFASSGHHIEPAAGPIDPAVLARTNQGHEGQLGHRLVGLHAFVAVVLQLWIMGFTSSNGVTTPFMLMMTDAVCLDFLRMGDLFVSLRLDEASRTYG